MEGSFRRAWKTCWPCRELGITPPRPFSALRLSKNRLCWMATWLVFSRVWEPFAEISANRRAGKSSRGADAYLEPKSPGDWNQAMMELGATLCSPKSPQCLLCPVAQFCEGRKLGIAD